MRRVSNRAEGADLGTEAEMRFQLVGTAKGNKWRLNAGEKLRKKDPAKYGCWGSRDLDEAMMRWY